MKRLRSHQGILKKVSILAISLTFIAGCTETAPVEPVPKVTAQQQALKSVKVTKIIKQKITDPLKRAADVQSSVSFGIIVKAGGDIKQILKKRGDMVREGEVIVRLNSGDAKFQKENASLAVKTAQDAIKRAKEQAKVEMNNKKLELSSTIQKMEQALFDLGRSYNKMRNDYDVGLVTKDQLYQTEVQLNNNRLDLDQLKLKKNTLELSESQPPELETQLKYAQNSLKQVEESMTYLDVKAPVSGILTETSLETGMTLQAGNNIGLIQKLDPIKIKGYLTEEESKLVSSKTELTYYLPETTKKSKGKISFLSKVIDPETKAYEINLDVPNKEMILKPGMKLWIQLTDEADQIALTVPTYSIVKDGDNAFVFVLKSDSVEKRKVQLGRLNEPNQEVLHGVDEGEMVVISNINQLIDKEKVQWVAVNAQ
ncbi:MAG: efflux RND transporter periplasmic adaptor subunit [Paenibacillaceae bacterium]